jgi:8-oxo-dGTP diphosphatase
VTVYLVRHAAAGRRSSWTGDDDQRPLSKAGRRQARRLVDVLDAADVAQIVSSPYVRCRQSVEPLAAQRRLPVELSDALAEGAPLADALRLIDKMSDRPSVLCTHGDIVEGVLRHLADQGVPGTTSGKPRMEKGSVWALDTVDGSVVGAEYRPPPKAD